MMKKRGKKAGNIVDYIEGLGSDQSLDRAEKLRQSATADLALGQLLQAVWDGCRQSTKEKPRQQVTTHVASAALGLNTEPLLFEP